MNIAKCISLDINYTESLKLSIETHQPMAMSSTNFVSLNIKSKESSKLIIEINQPKAINRTNFVSLDIKKERMFKPGQQQQQKWKHQ